MRRRIVLNGEAAVRFRHYLRPQLGGVAAMFVWDRLRASARSSIADGMTQSCVPHVPLCRCAPCIVGVNPTVSCGKCRADGASQRTRESQRMRHWFFNSNNRFKSCSIEAVSHSSAPHLDHDASLHQCARCVSVDCVVRLQRADPCGR